jgi:hypothetical protein
MLRGIAAGCDREVAFAFAAVLRARVDDLAFAIGSLLELNLQLATIAAYSGPKDGRSQRRDLQAGSWQTAVD